MEAYERGDRPSCWCIALFFLLSVIFMIILYFYYQYLFWPCLWTCVATTAIYGLDKILAFKKWYRIPEIFLQLLALIGGWPGAQLGQIIFHHKTSKSGFQIFFRFTVVINVIVFIILVFTVLHLDCETSHVVFPKCEKK